MCLSHIMREANGRCVFSHIMREANFATDFLAEFAMEFPLGCHKLEGPPEDLLP